MAENGKNRLAIFTIFRLRRTDVILRKYRDFRSRPNNIVWFGAKIPVFPNESYNAAITLIGFLFVSYEIKQPLFEMTF